MYCSFFYFLFLLVIFYKNLKSFSKFFTFIYFIYIYLPILQMKDPDVTNILNLANMLETCQFELVWDQINRMHDLCNRIIGFNDSIRKFVCHVVGITFQTIDRPLLAELLGGKPQVNGKLRIQKSKIWHLNSH